jgi:hypothetical protein
MLVFFVPQIFAADLNTPCLLRKWLRDRLCGLVIRVPDYRSRGPLPDFVRSSGSGTGSTQLREDMYVYTRGGPQTALAPRPSLIYCAFREDN